MFPKQFSTSSEQYKMAARSRQSITPQKSMVKSPSKKEKESVKRLKEAVKFFTDPTSDTKVRANIKLSNALDTIIQEAQRNGLSEAVILTLVDIAASAKFADSTNSRLIKHLLPMDSIPEDAAVQSISWMCTNKPSHEKQALLLKWIVLTFDLLDGTEKLHALYGIIFYFIENDTLCPHACHLLYLLTRKEDVIAHRVRKLLSVQRRVGSQPHITGLLSIYKVFAPHLVSLSLPSTQRAYFKLTDRNWASKVREARERIQEGRPANTSMQRDAAHRTITDVAMVQKRRKLNPVPDLRSSYTTLDPRAEVMTKVPLEQVKSFEEFLDTFDHLELPSQAAAVLRSPVLQYLVACRRDQATTQRLNFWLSQTLQIELMDSGSCNGRTEQLLQLLINFMDFIQESVPVCEQFLTRYLLTWNGHDYRPYILKMISRFRIYQFHVLNDLVLEPLRALFFSSSVYFKCQVLHTLTELLRNYVTHEISRYHETAQRQKVEETETLLEDDDDMEARPLHSSSSVFSIRVAYFDPMNTVKKLVEFVDGLCSVALQLHQHHSLLLHHTLTFFELVASLYTKHGIVFSQMPAKINCYRAMFGIDPTACSRMCQIICNYKAEFTALHADNDIHKQWEEMKKGIIVLNSIILTLCNCLWRTRAFDTTMDHGVSLEYMEATKIPNPNKIFSMQGSLATVCFCKKFFVETQPASKWVEPQMIKSVHKPVYMEFLQRERMDGIVNFIQTFIRRTGASQTTDTSKLEQTSTQN
ncbi:centromere protein I [Strongylocentrotus purpuratus]|uniref:Centromere protein I n=1 Tax=Strongylocentrotus purpuratus TaxID=7668 RepID=A0A7M7RCQ5_STRPU|nr:centromere protein I [Strongylocentrotus purpuratus]|eukprot:XP_782308.3 PREDICTED: centromere protein I [Strongylocentrotus purpuratus]